MKKVRMILRAYGNPDFGQHCDIGEILVAEATDPEDWEDEFRDYCAWYREHGGSEYLGGGNWGFQTGMVFGQNDEGVHYLGRFSYNGRYWPDGSEDELWATPKKEIIKAKAMLIGGKTGVHAIDYDTGKPYELPLLSIKQYKKLLEEEEAKWRAEYGLAQ